ncbi:MAG TPA: hypothetical protein PLJ12_13975, partial [Planctomycetota bacterium]|nr:hypothetical protein [Planctomycetota bacterium]
MILSPSRILLSLGLLSGLAACGRGPNNAALPPDQQPFTASGKSTAIEVLDPSHPDQPFYHSMGNVPYGQFLVHTFRLRNLESQPITVLRTIPACSCSRVKRIRAIEADGSEVLGNLELEDHILTVDPGQEFDVDILMDTSKVTPNTSKIAILRVITDSEVQPYLTFEIHFVADKWFEMASPILDLGDVPLGGGVGATLQIYTRPTLHHARLVGVVEASEGVVAELVP